LSLLYDPAPGLLLAIEQGLSRGVDGLAEVGMVVNPASVVG